MARRPLVGAAFATVMLEGLATRINRTSWEQA
jgi:hypothetical protein